MRPDALTPARRPNRRVPRPSNATSERVCRLQPRCRETLARDRYTTTASAEAVASWNGRLFDHCMTSGKCHNAQTPHHDHLRPDRSAVRAQIRFSPRPPGVLSYRHTNNINHSGRHLHPSVPWVGGDSRATPQPLRRQIQARYRFQNDVHATRRAAARFLKYCCE